MIGWRFPGACAVKYADSDIIGSFSRGKYAINIAPLGVFRVGNTFFSHAGQIVDSLLKGCQVLSEKFQIWHLGSSSATHLYNLLLTSF